MFDGETFETIPMAFWETLGQYVYGYKDPVTKVWIYIGKGNGDRAKSHLKSKNYSLDDLYIIARNLENFCQTKTDLQSFILESYLISTHHPSDNSVAGHYKECFIMTKLSELFEEFKREQHDNFEVLPDWYTDHYSVIKGRVRLLTVNSSKHFVDFAVRKNLQPILEVSSDDDVVLKVAISANYDEKFEQLKIYCNALGISSEKIERVGSGEKRIYSIDPTNMTIDFAMKFIDGFFS